MFSKQQAIVGLTVVDVGIMLALLYIAGDIEGGYRTYVLAALVAVGIVIAYRMGVRV